MGLDGRAMPSLAFSTKLPARFESRPKKMPTFKGRTLDPCGPRVRKQMQLPAPAAFEIKCQTVDTHTTSELHS